jgi:sigma-B regulation protein RsbU (phosphoserine phosphatase)
MDHVPDFRDLFDNAPCGYVVLDERGRIVLVNETLRAWLDLPDDKLLAKRFLELLPVAGRIFYETHFAPLLRMQGYFHEVALDLVRRDRTRLPVLANASQRVDADGEVLETKLALFKASSRRKYERELVEANQAADEARREIENLNVTLTETGLYRDEFIAILGHDLRNPLASIGSGMRILTKEHLSPKGRQVIRLVEGSVSRMSRLIDDVLDFSRGRMGGGLAIARKKEGELHLHLKQVVAELSSASSRHIDILIDIPDLLFVDAERISQMVSNLLGNAISHGAEDKRIALSARLNDSIFIIAVSNGGDPIPPEVLGRLFQPFFRGGDAAERHAKGLGLGLHIASEIAKAHGGCISVSSSAEQTVFEFRMPICAEL